MTNDIAGLKDVSRTNPVKRLVSTDECWLYAGFKYNGYGRNSSGGVHVQMYEDKYGPVPQGLELDHLCEIPSCINPDHLEAVPHRVNIQRGMYKKRINTCRKGHEWTEENTIWSKHTYTGVLQRQCRTCRKATMKKYDAIRRGPLKSAGDK